jgi:hypothetical protein
MALLSLLSVKKNFSQNQCKTLTEDKKWILTATEIFNKTAQTKLSPDRQKFA